MKVGDTVLVYATQTWCSIKPNVAEVKIAKVGRQYYTLENKMMFDIVTGARHMSARDTGSYNVAIFERRCDFENYYEAQHLLSTMKNHINGIQVALCNMNYIKHLAEKIGIKNCRKITDDDITKILGYV